MNIEILNTLRDEISKQDIPENRINCQQFHKEKLKDPFGLKAPVLRKISKNYFNKIKHLSKNKILSISDYLIASEERYMRFFSFEWSQKVEKDYSISDFKLFESWLKKYINNWGACDHLSCGSLGLLIDKYPELTEKTMKWTNSKNLWLRRSSAVSMIKALSNGRLLEESFKVADKLLLDKEDMVQKGYGWMLKVAGNTYQDDVFKYVLKNKTMMPRTALRYAIEKFPKELRQKAMSK